MKTLTIRCPKCRVVAYTGPIQDGAKPPTQPFAVDCPSTACTFKGNPTRIVSTFRPDWTHTEFVTGWAPNHEGVPVPHNGRIVRVSPAPPVRKPTPPSVKVKPPTIARRVMEAAGAC